MMMTIENLTGHTINILLGNNQTKKIFPSVIYPKLKAEQNSEQVGEMDGIPILEIKFKTRERDLPPRKDGVIYIVSSIAAQASNRDDFYIVGDTVRGIDRRSILGCRGICKNPFIK